MKKAKVEDCWRAISEFRGYKLFIKKINIKDVSIYNDFELVFKSAIVSICGKNGIGKTSLLRLIYTILTKKNDFNLGVLASDNLAGSSVTICRDNQEIILTGVKMNTEDSSSSAPSAIPNVNYFDASEFSLKIIEEYKADSDKNGWFNNSTTFEFGEEILFSLSRISSKKYTKVKVYEISDIIPDIVFPYFEVEVDGQTYFSENMGQGEHKIFVLVWRIHSLNRNSILLLEEPESFLCPSSQMRLMEFMIEKSTDKKINIVLATHSEHVLKEQKISSVNILKKVHDKNQLVAAVRDVRFLTALGLSPEKKNIYLVEDVFAKKVLESLLRERSPDLLLTSYIHILQGESNIKVLTKHYFGNNGVKFVAVYDADHLGVKDDFDLQIPKVFLPSVDYKAPEIEVINCLKLYTNDYANLLNVNNSELIAPINSIQCDHHDFFMELAQNVVCVDIELLKSTAIRLWVLKNIPAIDRFIFELESVSEPLSVELLEKNEGEEHRYAKVLNTGFKYFLDQKYDAYKCISTKGRLKHSHIKRQMMIELL